MMPLNKERRQYEENVEKARHAGKSIDSEWLLGFSMVPDTF